MRHETTLMAITANALSPKITTPEIQIGRSASTTESIICPVVRGE